MASNSVVAIIPLYNGARYIAESLRSILGQTKVPDEILVVDDGSSDDGPAIVREVQLSSSAEIRLITKANGGQSSARNFGVRYSRGTLVALLDQDDVWYPDHLEKLCAPFEKDPHCRLGWTYSNLDQVDQEGQMVRHGMLDFLRGPHPKADLYKLVDRDMYVLPSASVFTRKAFDSVGGFDERLIGYEDDDFFLRIFRAGFDNLYLNERLSKWRVYPGSTSGTRKMVQSGLIFGNKLLESYSDSKLFPHVADRLVAPRFAATLGAEAYRALRAGERSNYYWALSGMRSFVRKMVGRRRALLSLICAVGSSYLVARALYMTGAMQMLRWIVSRRRLELDRRAD